jgi:hypothetical protein
VSANIVSSSVVVPLRRTTIPELSGARAPTCQDRRVNRDWHAAHPMPPRATWEQRVAWHREHAAACGCRQPPPDIAAELARTAGDAPR